MTRRQVLCGGGVTGQTMTLRIRYAHYRPFSVPILERVLHGHSVDYAGIIFRVKSHSSVSKIPVEGDRSCSHIQALEVETGACLETVLNRGLNLFFILITGAATRKYYEDYKKSCRGT
jgi:hypothetical protein